MGTEKIKYHKRLYLSEGISRVDLMKLKHDLEKQPLKANVYLITISSNEQEMLDIYHSKYLIQKYYKERPPYVVGITKKKAEAFSLVEQMMQECVATRRDADLRAYLVGE